MAYTAVLGRGFCRGFMDGVSAPTVAFSPPKLDTRFDGRILEPTYVGPETDQDNLKRDFEKASGQVLKDAKAECPRQENG